MSEKEKRFNPEVDGAPVKKDAGNQSGHLGVGWWLILHSQFILIGLLVLGAAILKLLYR